ncbi:UNVERIFIED_CONTAM: hypothetical protein FKN15_057613 [Acipenser sinensis]
MLASLPLKPPGTVVLAPSSAAWRTKIGALSAGAHGGMLPPPREKGRAACPNARQDGTACPETEEGEEWSILEESKDDDACPSAREGGAVVSRARRRGPSAISSAKGGGIRCHLQSHKGRSFHWCQSQQGNRWSMSMAKASLTSMSKFINLL